MPALPTNGLLQGSCLQRGLSGDSGTGQPISARAVTAALTKLDPLWNELFPAEQARIVQLLIERIDVTLDGIAIRFRTEGFANLAASFPVNPSRRKAA